MLLLFYFISAIELFLINEYFPNDIYTILMFVLVIFFNINVYYWLKKKKQKKKWLTNNIRNVDKMSGHDFELFLQAHFQKKRYIVKHVGKSGDFGADLIIQKGRKKIVVQAKRYSSNVGVRAIQEAIAARDYYKCKDAIVITNSHFTRNAKEMANKCNVKLMDREYIVRYFDIPQR